MRRAGLAGLPLRRKAKRVPSARTVTDLVNRDFRRDGPNQLWVTDITEHPRAKASSTAASSSTPTPAASSDGPSTPAKRADLATSALGMAIDSRSIAGQIPGGTIHGDHGTQAGVATTG